MGLSTKIINAKPERTDAHGAMNFPVYRTATFEFPDSETMAAAFQHRPELYSYSRVSNPTVNNLENKLKAASGAETAIALSSGMAAISNAFFALAYAGSNIVSSPHLFGNTVSFFKSTLADFGIEIRFVNTDNLDEIAAATDEKTCAFFCELITNPHLEIADLAAISELLKAQNVPMLVDTTLVPCGFDARAFGVDVELISTTKYISGGGTGLGGAILDYGTFDWRHNPKLNRVPKPKGMSRFAFKLRAEITRNLGAALSPDNAYQQSLGIESLELRYEHMSANAYKLAQFLSTQPQVVKVNYPNLPTSPYKTLADKMFSGNAGAMLTFNLPTKEDCFAMMDKLQIIRRATNVFDNKTLAIHPESTIYGTFSPEMKQLVGIEPNLIRLAVGLENVEDLETDLRQALK